MEEGSEEGREERRRNHGEKARGGGGCEKTETNIDNKDTNKCLTT